MSEEQKEPEEEVEYIVESDAEMLLEFIQAAYFAMSSIEAVDIEILPSDTMKKRIRRINRQSIRILDYSINKLYNDIFDEEDKEQDNR